MATVRVRLVPPPAGPPASGNGSGSNRGRGGHRGRGGRGGIRRNRPRRHQNNNQQNPATQVRAATAAQPAPTHVTPARLPPLLPLMLPMLLLMMPLSKATRTYLKSSPSQPPGRRTPCSTPPTSPYVRRGNHWFRRSGRDAFPERRRRRDVLSILFLSPTLVCSLLLVWLVGWLACFVFTGLFLGRLEGAEFGWDIPLRYG